MNAKPKPSSQRGVSMIEVLVVIVLFSFGLIGMVGLQAKAVQVSVKMARVRLWRI